MKLKTLLLALLAALLATSVALAHGGPPPGKGKPADKGRPADKGKPSRTGPNCRPRVAVILKGTLASDPEAGDTSFMLNVTKANRHGRAYVGATHEIATDAKTKVRRGDERTLASLEPGDPALVHAKACKADLAGGATPALTAKHVRARPPAPTS